jgi:hypothetical protein
VGWFFEEKGERGSERRREGEGEGVREGETERGESVFLFCEWKIFWGKGESFFACRRKCHRCCFW